MAGVGVGGMFTWLSQGLAAMARMGGQVQVAQCIGRGERERAHGFAQDVYKRQVIRYFRQDKALLLQQKSHHVPVRSVYHCIFRRFH